MGSTASLGHALCLDISPCFIDATTSSLLFISLSGFFLVFPQMGYQ